MPTYALADEHVPAAVVRRARVVLGERVLGRAVGLHVGERDAVGVRDPRLQVRQRDLRARYARISSGGPASSHHSATCGSFIHAVHEVEVRVGVGGDQLDPRRSGFGSVT